MNQIFRIRFNTDATDDSNCWRIILQDGTQLLVDHLDIKVPTTTTKDWIEEIGQHKYHISCFGSLVMSVENRAIIV